MKLILIIGGLIATVTARPEPPVGYNYPSPHSLPSGNHGQIPSFQYATSHQQSGFNTAHDVDSNHFSGLTTGNGYNFGAISGGFQSGQSASYPSGPSVIQSGPSTVHKHVYVHVAPEEPEEIRPRKPIFVGAPQKHYKIIFIKAPAPPTPIAPVIPPQVQNEEKTLVYVLVKKPEEAPEIHIPTPAPTQPAKPEVYFIKYDTKKEQVGGGIGSIGGGIESIGGDSIGSIGGGSIGSIGGGIGSQIGSKINGVGDGNVFGTNSLTSHSLGDLGQTIESTAGPSVGTGLGSVISSAKYGPPGYHK